LPKNVSATVTNAVALPQGRYRLTLDNGQIWETHDADWSLAFKSSDAVTITRMAMGGYQLSMTGRGPSVGVKRIK
jgi:hypothetical protein